MFQVDIGSSVGNNNPLRASSSAVSRNTGKSISASNLFRVCYDHLSKTFRLPVTLTPPTSINVQSWIEKDAVESEVISHTQVFQIGPSTEEEFKSTPFGNLGRLQHLSLFHQLSTLIITKQQLHDVDIDLPVHIQHLDLSYNRFKHVPTMVVRMKYLSILKMAGNSLQEIKSIHSLPMSSLTELHVQDNEHLRLLDLSGMDKLQYIQCKRAHPSLQFINCACREMVFDDQHKGLKRLFIDQEDELAYTAHNNQSQHLQQIPGLTSAWTFLHSTDWVDELHLFRQGNKRLVEKIRERSIRELQTFFRCLETAFLLEAVVPAETKIALKQLQSQCAFRRFYPSFDALSTASLKKTKLTQFAAFLRFCEQHECFLDWSQLDRPSSLLELFAASKYTLDLCGLFPSPNEMNYELGEVSSNPALFASVLVDNFSNQHALERWKAQREEREKASALVKDRAALLENEIRAFSQAGCVEHRHLEDLVQFELLHSYTLNHAQT